MLENARGGLRILVRPDWRSIVQAEDLEYMDSLLRDFLNRADEQPAALFKQLSSLGVGPLIASEVGKEISNHPRLMDLVSRFEQL